jgi:hypothetical protein
MRAWVSVYNYDEMEDFFSKMSYFLITSGGLTWMMMTTKSDRTFSRSCYFSTPSPYSEPILDPLVDDLGSGHQSGHFDAPLG